MTDQELIRAAQDALSGTPIEFIVGARHLMPFLAERLTALQSENGSKDKEIERLAKKATLSTFVKYAMKRACEDLVDAEAALSRVEAERDAAVIHIPHICAYCILKDGPCKIRDEGGIRYGAYTCGVFEWRGAQGEA